MCRMTRPSLVRRRAGSWKYQEGMETSDGTRPSAGGRALRQAVHEDVEQQLEALVRVDRREVVGQRYEVGELPGRQRGEVAGRIILRKLRDRAGVVLPVVPVLATPLRATRMPALRSLAARARLGGRLVQSESVDDGDEQVLAGHGQPVGDAARTQDREHLLAVAQGVRAHRDPAKRDGNDVAV